MSVEEAEIARLTRIVRSQRRQAVVMGVLLGTAIGVLGSFAWRTSARLDAARAGMRMALHALDQDERVEASQELVIEECRRFVSATMDACPMDLERLPVQSTAPEQDSGTYL